MINIDNLHNINIFNKHINEKIDKLELGTTKNVVVVGKVQSGKTEYIINLLNDTINNNKIPILIASDRLGVLDQYKTRFSEKLLKMLTIINTSFNVQNQSFNENVLYGSILSIARLKKIKELIFHGGVNFKKQFVLIIDEGDLSIKNVTCMLEKLQRKMDNFGIFLKRIFITATPFSVTNSKSLSYDIEKYIIIPPYKEGFVYRDYMNMDIIYTKYVKKIATSDNLNMNKISQFIKIHLIDNQVSKQPNIGLMKIFHNNKDKHLFAEKLNQCIKNLNIIVYTGKGSILYYNKKVKILEKQGSCIAQTLQKLKNEQNTKPILIISYNMASRSQTFKSIDHEWILTHFFIDLPNNSSTEQTIQALRCNGQYNVNDPLIKIYVSKSTHDRITKLMINNDIYINQCYKNQTNNMRDCIYHVNFIKVKHFKMCSRKGLDDTKIIKSNGDAVCKNYQEAVIMAKFLVKENNCDNYINITDHFLTIHCEEMIKYISESKKYDINNQDNIYTKLKIIFENDKNFKGLTTIQQNFLRKLILKHLDNKYNSCQIGYYHERTKMLNKINHRKPVEYQSQVICELLQNGNVSVVIYVNQYYKYPEKYDNKVLIWRNTNGNYHLCVNKDKPKHTYISLKHV